MRIRRLRHFADVDYCVSLLRPCPAPSPPKIRLAPYGPAGPTNHCQTHVRHSTIPFVPYLRSNLLRHRCRPLVPPSVPFLLCILSYSNHMPPSPTTALFPYSCARPPFTVSRLRTISPSPSSSIVDSPVLPFCSIPPYASLLIVSSSLYKGCWTNITSAFMIHSAIEDRSPSGRAVREVYRIRGIRRPLYIPSLDDIALHSTTRVQIGGKDSLHRIKWEERPRRLSSLKRHWSRSSRVSRSSEGFRRASLQERSTRGNTTMTSSRMEQESFKAAEVIGNVHD